MVELWGDPHVEFHVKLVVVRDEWSGHSSARNNVHHWCFDLFQTEANVFQSFFCYSLLCFYAKKVKSAAGYL